MIYNEELELLVSITPTAHLNSLLTYDILLYIEGVNEVQIE
jgi:hypothetical protein